VGTTSSGPLVGSGARPPSFLSREKEATCPRRRPCGPARPTAGRSRGHPGAGVEVLWYSSDPIVGERSSSVSAHWRRRGGAYDRAHPAYKEVRRERVQRECEHSERCRRGRLRRRSTAAQYSMFDVCGRAMLLQGRATEVPFLLPDDAAVHRVREAVFDDVETPTDEHAGPVRLSHRMTSRRKTGTPPPRPHRRREIVRLISVPRRTLGRPVRRKCRFSCWTTVLRTGTPVPSGRR